VKSFIIVALATSLAACSGATPDNASGNPAIEASGTEIIPASEGDPTAGADDAVPLETGGDGVAPVVADWTGKWTGVEGLALDIAPGDTPDTRLLRVASMDGTREFTGRVNDNNTISFDRDGMTAIVRHGSGAATGLKWLADKENCLIIATGEGFCRD